MIMLLTLNLAGLTDTEVLAQAHTQAMAMEDNSSVFTTPKPAAAEFTALMQSLQSALSAQSTAQQLAQQRTVEKNNARAALETALRTRANYVEDTANGDETKLRLGGFALRAAPVPVGLPAAPQNLSATIGDLEGHLDLSWDKVRGAKSYVIQACADPINPANWAHKSVSTASSHTVNGMLAGTKWWFRVAAVGAAGQGPWSDVACKMAV
jgi:hypothetical protein